MKDLSEVEAGSLKTMNKAASPERQGLGRPGTTLRRNLSEKHPVRPHSSTLV